MLGLHMGVSLGAMAGGGAGPDTVGPLISDFVYVAGPPTSISFTVDEDCTAFLLYNTSSTPLSGSVIEAGAVYTRTLVAGFNYPSWDDSAWGEGTWYIHFAFKDAAGNYAVITQQHIIGYQINAVGFDGASYLTSSGLTNDVPGKQGTFLMSFYIGTEVPSTTAILMALRATTQDRFKVTLSRNTGGSPPADRGYIGLFGKTSGNVNVINFNLANGSIVLDRWYTIAVAWDTATSTFLYYIRQNGGPWTIPTFQGTPTILADGIIGPSNSRIIGAGQTGGFGVLPAGSALADVIYSTDKFVNIGNLALLNGLLPSVNKGANGQTPFGGSTPLIFQSGPTANWHTCKGASAGFTKVGALTTFGSIPT